MCGWLFQVNVHVHVFQLYMLFFFCLQLTCTWSTFISQTADIYSAFFDLLCVLSLAMANLRAALVALSSSNSGALAASGGVGMPGCVVLVSNLNEKVCGCCHSLCCRQDYFTLVSHASLVSRSNCDGSVTKWQSHILLVFMCNLCVENVIDVHSISFSPLTPSFLPTLGCFHSTPPVSLWSGLEPLQIASQLNSSLLKMITPYALFILFGMCLLRTSLCVCIALSYLFCPFLDLSACLCEAYMYVYVQVYMYLSVLDIISHEKTLSAYEERLWSRSA